MHDDKCTDVVALDVRGRSQVTDFIVVGSGASERQMRSAGQRVADLGETSGFALFRSNKDQPGQTWFVLDFVDAVVHVFESGARAYYDLEMMWGDAPRLMWERAAAPVKPATAPAPKPSPAATPGPKPAAAKSPTKKQATPKPSPAKRPKRAAATKPGARAGAKAAAKAGPRAGAAKPKARPSGAKPARKSKA